MIKLLKDERFRLWLLWGFAVLLYFFANLQKVVIPRATFNEVQQYFSSTAGSITGLGAVFMDTYAFSQLFGALPKNKREKFFFHFKTSTFVTNQLIMIENLAISVSFDEVEDTNISGYFRLSEMNGEFLIIQKPDNTFYFLCNNDYNIVNICQSFKTKPPLPLGRGHDNQRIDSIQTENLILHVMRTNHINNESQHGPRIIIPNPSVFPQFK